MHSPEPAKFSCCTQWSLCHISLCVIATHSTASPAMYRKDDEINLYIRWQPSGFHSPIVWCEIQPLLDAIASSFFRSNHQLSFRIFHSAVHISFWVENPWTSRSSVYRTQLPMPPFCMSTLPTHVSHPIGFLEARVGEAESKMCS